MCKLLYALIVTASLLVSSYGQDLNVFQQKAFGYQALKNFERMFESNYPSDASAGKSFYDGHKKSDFQSTGKSSVIFELKSDRVSEVLGIFRSTNLISSEDEAELKQVVTGSPTKTIRETVFIRSNGELIYGIVGVLNLPKKISLFTTFQRHQFTSRPEVSLQAEDNCAFWGYICSYKMSFSLPEENFEASEDEAEDLHQYLKQSALNLFREDSGPYVEYLERESKRYERFLPNDVKVDLDRISANPDKQPDQVLSKDPLRAERYEEIGN